MSLSQTFSKMVWGHIILLSETPEQPAVRGKIGGDISSAPDTDIASDSTVLVY